MINTYGGALSALSAKPNRVVTTHQGGEAYTTDSLRQARRFLILGSAGGTFYVGERELTAQNAAAVVAALDEHGAKVVDLVVEVSEKGLAPKQSPTLMALALAAAHADARVRKAALAAIPRVCRTGTMLFEFAEYVQTLRGWGRGLRTAVGSWYLDKPVKDLAYQAIKYRQRGGWTHADLLRLTHPRTANSDRNLVFKWIVDGELPPTDAPIVVANENIGGILQLFAFEDVQRENDKARVVQLVTDYRLPREALPTQWLKDPDVWDALLQDMPVTAMVRNLGNMGANGLLVNGSDAARLVVACLADDERLRRSRIHPLQLLVALKTYEGGQGFQGKNSWPVVADVVDALDGAFYAAFGNVTPTHKRLRLALDISGSMEWSQIAGMPITPRQGAAAMALVTKSVEPNAEIVAFSGGLREIAISPRQRLDDVLRTIDRMPADCTRCELPIADALKKGRAFDAFFVYTDSETGGQSPYNWLRPYRAKLVRDAKLCVVAMQANNFTIADPTDPHALDVVGFDASTPEVLSSFVRGEV